VLARGGGGEATAKPLGNCDYICVLFIDTHEADGAAAPEKMMDALTMRSHNARVPEPARLLLFTVFFLWLLLFYCCFLLQDLVDSCARLYVGLF
jgi:hypothetical protein